MAEERYPRRGPRRDPGGVIIIELAISLHLGGCPTVARHLTTGKPSRVRLQVGTGWQRATRSGAGDDHHVDNLAATHRQRRARRMRGPGSGRSVTYGVGVTRWPGSMVSRKRWAIAARSRTASIIANPLPMHWRGPPPKGK